ncbi:hypothetical protein ACTFIR_002667 [Dictyostelium discoideum]
MISNQNTINNIDNYKKCEHHGHRTDTLESTSNIISLKNYLKYNVHHKVIDKIETNETILKQSNDKYNKIKSQFDINNSSLKKEFKEFHDIISFIELEIKKLLETTYQNNTLLNTIITSSINNENEILSTIINNKNKNKNENENENENNNNQILTNNDQHDDFVIDRDTMKIIKQYQQSLIVLNNNNNIDNSNKINEYDNQIIHLNNEIIDDFKNKLKSIYTLNKCTFKIEIDENNNKFFKWDKLKFYIYKEGDFLKPNKNECIAFEDNCNILSKLKKNQLPPTVMLLDGFNQKLTPGIIPDGVKLLYLGDIKQELIMGFIPKTVTSVHLLDGFNQKFTPGVLSEGFESLYLYDFKQELLIGPIPKTVRRVYLKYRFNQKLTLPGILPDSVESLDLGDIKQELIISPIPNTVTRGSFFDRLLLAIVIFLVD